MLSMEAREVHHWQSARSGLSAFGLLHHHLRFFPPVASSHSLQLCHTGDSDQHKQTSSSQYTF